MAENNENQDKPKKSFKEEQIEKHRSRYMKKNKEEMTEDEKKREEEDEEAMRALNNGPTADENRSCQDLIFCLLFIAFIVGCAVVTGLGFSQGDPSRLTYFYDEDGVPCGKNGTDAENYPYLYLYNAVSSAYELNATEVVNKGICVTDCPTTYPTELSLSSLKVRLNCKKTKLNPDCLVDTKNIFLSTPFLKKICIPSYTLYMELKANLTNNSIKGNNGTNNTTINNTDIANKLDGEYTAAAGLINLKIINKDKLFDYLGDLVTIYPIFFACIGIALVIGFIYLFIIRLCGGCIAYFVIFFILVLLVLLGVFFHRRMSIYNTEKDTIYKNIMLAFAIIFYSLGFIWLMVILCSCNKIRLAIAITEVAARFVWSVWTILFVPIIMFIVIGCYVAYWIALSVFLYSSGEIKKSSSSFLATVVW